jgi:translation initiation factor 2 alpha subunit (eIF-2alpha)
MKDPIQLYSNKHPKVDEVVMIRYDDIADNCVEVTLMEYNMKGIIVFKELSKRRLRKRNLRQAAPIGKLAPAIVTNDSTDNIISLTRKRITDEETKKFSEKFKKNKKIISIFENLSYETKMPFNEVLEKISHKLDEFIIESEEYESLYDLFNDNNDNFYYLEKLDLEKNILDSLEEIILKNFIKPPEKIQIKMAIVSNGLEGVNIIKDIFNTVIENNKSLTYYLEKTPYYIIEMLSNDVKNDMIKLKSISDIIEKYIVNKGGNFKLM